MNGVGYDAFVPLSTFYSLGEPGDEVALRIHTHVREDALTLYGFATRLEQDLFERLIGISGIGPKLALAVLSGIEPKELVRAVERGDVARLTAIPGVGKKTSERMVQLILGLAELPSPHDAADALAVAICHVHSCSPARVRAKIAPPSRAKAATSWRHYRPARS